MQTLRSFGWLFHPPVSIRRLRLRNRCLWVGHLVGLRSSRGRQKKKHCCNFQIFFSKKFADTLHLRPIPSNKSSKHPRRATLLGGRQSSSALLMSLETAIFLACQMLLVYSIVQRSSNLVCTPNTFKSFKCACFCLICFASDCLLARLSIQWIKDLRVVSPVDGFHLATIPKFWVKEIVVHQITKTIQNSLPQHHVFGQNCCDEQLWRCGIDGSAGLLTGNLPDGCAKCQNKSFENSGNGVCFFSRRHLFHTFGLPKYTVRKHVRLSGWQTVSKQTEFENGRRMPVCCHVLQILKVISWITLNCLSHLEKIKILPRWWMNPWEN